VSPIVARALQAMAADEPTTMTTDGKGDVPGVSNVAIDLDDTGFFAFRTPLLPYEDLLSLSANLVAPVAGLDLAALENALVVDRRRVLARLFSIVARPEVREALFVASPSLEESLNHWFASPNSERGRKVERTLVRYIARMSARPTPFGLFAGCSMGDISVAPSSEETRLRVGERASYLRHTRLDMDYICSLTDALANDRSVRERLEYRPNCSLYRVAGRLRYAETRIESNVRTHYLVDIEPNEFLESMLARATGGARPSELAAALVATDGEITLEDAHSYVDELIDSQVLVSDLRPAVTGPEPIHGLLESLARLPGATSICHTLRAAHDVLEAIDAAGLGTPAHRYREVASSLAALPIKPDVRRLFQVDMVKPAPQAILGRNVVNELVRAVELLRRICPSTATRDPLVDFVRAFEERYQGREVPLVAALDEEMGIGFERSSGLSAEPSPLLAGLFFPPGPNEGGPFSTRTGCLLAKIENALRRGTLETVLSDDDIQQLGEPEPRPLPDSFSVMATLIASSEEQVAAGEFRILVGGASGASGARLLGRFCHADALLLQRTAAHLRREESLQPDAIFAEIVHLPEGRVGNVIHRPHLRDHEIPFLGRSSVASDRQIAVSDLLVSIVGGRIVLRSARLGKEVIPRLSNAHNFMGGTVGVYRFLCLLQAQGVAGALGWSWGQIGRAHV